MKCSTGKVKYDTRQLAEQALVEVRGRFLFREESGPVAVYQCEDCGSWHFTSKGPTSEILNESDTKAQISHQREVEFWTQKLKR